MAQDEAGTPGRSSAQIVEQLLGILAELDRNGSRLAAIHVCQALEVLSPQDPRITRRNAAPGG